MLKCKLVLPLIFLIVFLNTITGQNEIYKAERVEITYGLSRTFHYNSPFLLFLQCIEGCSAKSQSPKILSRIDFKYYQPLFNRFEIKTGIGLNQIGSDEVVEDFFGGDFESSNTFTFVNFSIGQRSLFLEKTKLNLFLENDLFMDMTIRETRELYGNENVSKAKNLKLINFSYQFSIGTLWNVREETALVLAMNFKTALRKYDVNNSTDYKPYAIGLNVGISKKL